MEHAVDKSGWPPGPWMDEPDFLSWTHPNGMACAIYRGSSGALCGYVRVASDHPAHGRGYSEEIPELGGRSAGDIVDVHGGLTFSRSRLRHEDESVGWWFGFDCAHLGDLSPARAREYGEGWYRGIDFVKREVDGLATTLDGIAVRVAEEARAIDTATLVSAAADAVALLGEHGLAEHIVTRKLAAAVRRES